jgi:hypothetical protein
MKYVLGRGEVSIGVGIVKENKVPVIRIGKIEGGFAVGESLLGKQVPETESSFIVIENLEGLKVLEEAVKLAKKQLKGKSNKKNK